MSDEANKEGGARIRMEYPHRVETVDTLNYKVEWNREQGEYMGTCEGYPYVSVFHSTREGANAEIRDLISQIRAQRKIQDKDMQVFPMAQSTRTVDDIIHDELIKQWREDNGARPVPVDWLAERKRDLVLKIIRLNQYKGSVQS